MGITTATVHLVVLLVSSATCGGLAGYAWLRRAEPGARPFLGLMVAFALYSTGHLVGLSTAHPQWRLLWENVQWMGSALVPLFWMTFALDYTGYDDLVTRRTVAVLAVVPAVTVLLTWTNPWHGLMWDLNGVVVVDGLAIVEQALGPWYWVFLAYTYALLVVGSAMLLRLVFVSEYLYEDQMLLLALGVAVPWAANVMTNLGLTPIRDPTLDITPYGFAISGLAFGHAVFRYRLLDLVPATRQVGRRRAVSNLEDGVLILDDARRTVYLNRTAADVLDCEPAEALGEPARSLVDVEALDLEAPDALGELDIDDRTFEVRVSAITDRDDRRIGHTVVLHDVTERKRLERRLRRQRDELEQLDRINAVIRAVNQALVGATTREAVEEAVAARLTASDLYDGAWVGRGLLEDGETLRWTVAVDDRPGSDADAPAAAPESELRLADGGAVVEADGDRGGDRGAWTTVPISYERVVYGVLVLYSDRAEPFGDRELAVLDELGGTIGHAIDAVENRRLLTADAVLELELSCEDGPSPLVALSAAADCRLTLDGLVPAGGRGLLAYCSVEGGEPAAVREAAADAPGVEGARAIGDGAGPAGGGAGARDDEGVVELSLAGGSLLAPLVAYGANVTDATAEGGRCRITAEVATDADVRELVERVQRDVPAAELVRKRELERPLTDVGSLPTDSVADLTDRQREAIEAAYRAGYFDWPRDSTAEEVAESMDISPPTLHHHLRKAQSKLLTRVLEPGG